MMVSVGAYVPEGILSRAAYESRLEGASKSQLVRIALLRLVMPAAEARETVYGSVSNLAEINGRVNAQIPEHEMQLIRERYPDVPFSDLARLALALAAGMPDHQARDLVESTRGTRGRPPGSKNRAKPTDNPSALA